MSMAPASPGARQAARAARVRHFWRRMLLHGALSAGLLALSLGVGMWGYWRYEGLGWRDAFLNAAMLLSGMGPIDTQLSEAGKLFAGIYALYSGLVVLAIAGLLLTPAVHRVMHKVHWDDEP
ncbi:MAG TPA: hypothetical protein VMF13_21735 [Luteitalea sp.]|nr:hypothetical protein [Luteitalea sp.]